MFDKGDLHRLAQQLWLRIVAVVSLVGALASIWVLSFWRLVPWWFLDGSIYTAGGKSAWDGIPYNLYENFSGVGPFTYTPFAAASFGPLALLPSPFDGIAFQSVSLLAILLTIWVAFRIGGLDGKTAAVFSALLSWPLLFFYPVFQTVGLGQIGGQLMAMVVIDLVLISSRRYPRGILTGIAAAIKLTPAAFLLFMVVRRDWRSVGWFFAGFVASTGIGFLVMPQDSWEFWTSRIWQTGRVGSQFAAANQCIAAVLSRALQPGQEAISGWVQVLWLVLILLVVAGGAVAIWFCLRSERIFEGLLIAAFVSTLISPMSWLHHWIWVVPAIVLLLMRAHETRKRWPLVAAVLGVIAFAANPRWLFGTTHMGAGTFTWAPWQQLAGALPVWWGLAYVISLGISNYKNSVSHH